MNKQKSPTSSPCPKTDLKTGEILVSEGFISLEDVQRVIAIQKKGKASPLSDSNRLFGIILCDLNLITPLDNFLVLHKYGKLLDLNKVLEKNSPIPARTLKLAVLESRELKIPFLTMLLNKKIITETELQKLVYNLYRIPFRKLESFLFNPARKTELAALINKNTAINSRIIPLAKQKNVVLMGITEPSALLDVEKLRNKFALLRFKTVFIPFSRFKTLFNLLYGEELSPPGAQKSLPDISLLLNFRTTINDPNGEKEKVSSLYKSYETVRALTNGENGENPGSSTARSQAFYEFIAGEHSRIKIEHQVEKVEYFIKKKGQDLFIMAVPKGVAPPWQK